jgi:hypothetical protein
VLLLLHRLKIKLDRDVIFLAEAGEESSTQVGIDFMVEKHWDKIAAEFAMAEGGGMSEDDGTVKRGGRCVREALSQHEAGGPRRERPRVSAARGQSLGAPFCRPGQAGGLAPAHALERRNPRLFFSPLDHQSTG